MIRSPGEATNAVPPLTRRDLLALAGAGALSGILSSCSPNVPESARIPPLAELLERYASLGLTDVHNHGASRGIAALRRLWADYALSRVVLFGSVSEPQAVADDERTWDAYLAHPELIVPFFSGIDLNDPASLDVARERLERGFVGVGEIAAASRSSPVVSGVAWKADHPLGGMLPQLYELCAEFRAPLLLHIDPLSGATLARLEEALDAHPRTTFIVAHVNAYTPSATAATLLERHPNLYVDFFAGFSDHDADGRSFDDFVAIARAHPDRWLLGSDSGYGLESEAAALESMYRFLHLLGDDDLARRIAFENFDGILARRRGD